MDKRLMLFCLTFSILLSCSRTSDKKIPVEVQKPEVIIPEFNSDSAYAYIDKQCSFGPRVPNTKAHISCGNFLHKKLKSFADTVFVQSGKLTAFDGTTLSFRNFIAAFNPDKTNRVMLFAHWDTRPWADQDKTDKNIPALGADDGASGVGVLIEMARQLKLNPVSFGVDIIFFDAEDWGKEGGGPEAEDSYALGTQYWAKNPHQSGYTARYGILLDMVGSKSAQFRREGNSKEAAGFVVQKVWQSATNLGFGNYFLNEDGGWVTDDHVYVNRMNIPSIDIIASDLSSRSGFPPHWHTHDDTMENIDRKTLKAVGQTLLSVVYNEGQ